MGYGNSCFFDRKVHSRSVMEMLQTHGGYWYWSENGAGHRGKDTVTDYYSLVIFTTR